MLEYCSCASVIEDISHFVHRIYIYMILAKAADEPCSLNRFIKGGPVYLFTSTHLQNRNSRPSVL